MVRLCTLVLKRSRCIISVRSSDSGVCATTTPLVEVRAPRRQQEACVQSDFTIGTQRERNNNIYCIVYITVQ